MHPVVFQEAARTRSLDLGDAAGSSMSRRRLVCMSAVPVPVEYKKEKKESVCTCSSPPLPSVFGAVLLFCLAFATWRMPFTTAVPSSRGPCAAWDGRGAETEPYWTETLPGRGHIGTGKLPECAAPSER